MPYTLYGIPNCDTIKKAKTWLDNNEVEYQFHNYKTDNISSLKLETWFKQQPIDKVINKASSTFRKLSESDKASISEQNAAIALIQNQPSMIKRPILEDASGIVAIGFKPELYSSIFSDSK